MNISIPSALRERLEANLARQAYGSVSEYVRQFIRCSLCTAGQGSHTADSQ